MRGKKKLKLPYLENRFQQVAKLEEETLKKFLQIFGAWEVIVCIYSVHNKVVCEVTMSFTGCLTPY